MLKLRGLRVLLVEQDSDFAQHLIQAFPTTGHEVEVATDGASAYAKALAAPPDVVFLDTDMPGLDTSQVARSICAQTHWKRPLLVALYRNGAQQNVRRPDDAVFDLWLGKPVPLETLRGLLRRFHAFVVDTESFDPMI